MDRDKYRRGRLNKGLRDIAYELGYTPGEFSMLRFAEDARKLKVWMKDLDRGLVPEELGHMSFKDAHALAKREVDSLIKRERFWMEFFHPKLKSADVSLKNDEDSPFTIQIVRHGNQSAE